MVDKSLFSSDSNEWATPQDLFDLLNKEFEFDLDVCATPENAKCSRFFTKETDGLNKSWEYGAAWMNPPYSEIAKWMEKAFQESKRHPHNPIVALVPARTDTKWWFNSVAASEAQVRFLKGRLRFGDAVNSAPFPSAIVIFNYTMDEDKLWWDWKKSV